MRRALLTGALLLATLAPALAGVRVVDGDTIDLDGERIRLINIDTPETHHPRCERERVWGEAAKARLTELLKAPGELTVVRENLDRYRRTLAYVLVGENDVGDVLIAEGLAVQWKAGPAAKAARLRKWCED
jgi:endonuclease YncB( thermonuclease family)